MIEYKEDSVIPIPRTALWKLLESHREDGTIHRIHPLVLSQKTESRSKGETIVQRTIDARGRQLVSRWRLIEQPPDLFRWEILDGPGPWAPGSFVENRYTEAPGGTLVSSRGELKITVLPFFLPQKGTIRRVLGRTEVEDLGFVRASPSPT